MIKTAWQLKDLIRNLARSKSADAQVLMRNYMMERFLERISVSEYRDKFILKGGMLVAAMIGLESRTTMDIDGTVKGANVSVEDVEQMVADIVSVPMDDGVEFQIKRISEIMDEAEYPGIRRCLFRFSIICYGVFSESALFSGYMFPVENDGELKLVFLKDTDHIFRLFGCGFPGISLRKEIDTSQKPGRLRAFYILFKKVVCMKDPLEVTPVSQTDNNKIYVVLRNGFPVYISLPCGDVDPDKRL